MYKQKLLTLLHTLSYEEMPIAKYITESLNNAEI